MAGGVLALDLNSKNCGVACGGESDGSPRCMSWQLFGTETEDDLARSLATLYASIANLCKVLRPQYLYYEAPFMPHEGSGHTNARAIRSGLSLAAIAMAAGRNAGAITKPGHTQSWRKTFIGHGRPESPKEATIARCNLLGWKVANHDEADAAGLWCHAMSLHFPKWAPRATPLFAGAV